MQKTFKGLPLDFAGFFSLILLTACGSNLTAESSKIPGFSGNDSAPTRRNLKAGDDCGMTGTLAERLADCAQAPDAELGKGWKVLSRVGTETIHFNTLSGISVYEPTQKETKNFPDSRDLCQSAQPKGTIFRLPTVTELKHLEGLSYGEIKRYQYSRYWTSTLDNDYWPVLFKNYTDPDGSVDSAEPYHYKASTLCIGTAGGTISGMPAVSAVSRLPWDHQAECEKYASTLRSGQLEAMLTRYYGTYLNLVCGGTHAHYLLKDLNVSCVNVGGFYFMPVAKYTQEMDCR